MSTDLQKEVDVTPPPASAAEVVAGAVKRLADYVDGIQIAPDSPPVWMHPLAAQYPGLLLHGSRRVATHPECPKHVCGEILWHGILDGVHSRFVVFRGHATRSVRQCNAEIDAAIKAARLHLERERVAAK